MPFRATISDVETYAADRQTKGFNAVFLMTVQPDMNARGPLGRNVDEGFEIGFHDLAEGRLSKINIEYFQYFDKIIDVLINHGLTPVLQPVFHGYGWKGLDVAGPVLPPADYARYSRYLVARYGARPAIYLPCGDGAGTEPQVEAGAWKSRRGTGTDNPPEFTTGRTTAMTSIRTLTGWTSSPARPDTWATTSLIASRPCGPSIRLRRS